MELKVSFVGLSHYPENNVSRSIPKEFIILENITLTHNESDAGSNLSFLVICGAVGRGLSMVHQWRNISWWWWSFNIITKADTVLVGTKKVGIGLCQQSFQIIRSSGPTSVSACYGLPYTTILGVLKKTFPNETCRWVKPTNFTDAKNIFF